MKYNYNVELDAMCEDYYIYLIGNDEENYTLRVTDSNDTSWFIYIDSTFDLIMGFIESDGWKDFLGEEHQVRISIKENMSVEIK